MSIDTISKLIENAMMHSMFRHLEDEGFKRVLTEEQYQCMRDILVKMEKDFMGKDQRPNLHAVGLLVDIINALDSRVRGPAAMCLQLKDVEAKLDRNKNIKSSVFPMFKDEICEFIEKVDNKLNEEFGTKI